MKSRSLFLLFALALTAACASSGNSTNAPNLQFQLAQMNSPADMYYFRGTVPVQFALQINNPTNQSYTLRRLNLQSTGPGAYSLRTGDSPITYNVPANGTVTIPLTAWAFSRGGFMRSTEPVNIRGIAYFDGPAGSFSRLFTSYLTQQ